MSQSVGLAELIIYCWAMCDLCAFCCQMHRQLDDEVGHIFIGEWRRWRVDCVKRESWEGSG